jgi:Reverse transcriptase (RNA-dependent DNA polymerase)
MDKDCFTASILTDVSKAFDYVDHAILLHKLHQAGVRGPAHQIIQDYLFGRTQVVSSSSSVSSLRFSTRGVLQGSSLSALLFLININYILKLPLRCHLQLYTDDAILIYSNNNFHQMQRDMEDDLNTIYNWFYSNQLTFNANKTKYIIFQQKNKQIPIPQPLLVHGVEIERVSKSKYLGLILDNKLNWTDHINYIKSKIKPFLSLLMRTNYLLPSATKLSVYYSNIHSHLTYLSSVWGFSGNTRIEELAKFQNKAIRLIFWQEYRQGSNTDTLYTSHKILNLQKIIKYESLMTIFKLKTGLLRNDLIIPQYSDIHNYPTRNRANLYLPNPRTNYFKQSLFFDRMVLFNNLPNETKTCQNIVRFKKALKQHLST